MSLQSASISESEAFSPSIVAAMSHKQSPSATVYAVDRSTESPFELGCSTGVDMSRVEGFVESREDSVSEIGGGVAVKDGVEGGIC